MDFVNVILDGAHAVGDIVGGHKIIAIDRDAKTVSFEERDGLEPRVAALEANQALGNWSTTEQPTGRDYFGKSTFIRSYQGTLPTTAADTNLFTVEGATEIVDLRGRVTLVFSPTSRAVDIHTLASNDAKIHGQAIQVYGADAVHCYFQSMPDARFRGAAYTIMAEYTKT
jgi:hypothetical protein